MDLKNLSVTDRLLLDTGISNPQIEIVPLDLLKELILHAFT